MTKREENVFTMFTSVDNYLKDYRTIIDTIPVFADSVDEFSHLTSKIREKDIEYTGAVSGTALSKKEAEEDMIDTVLPVIKMLKIFARKSGLNDLLETVNISEGKLKNMRDNDMLSRVKAIAAKASENAEAAANYGVTAQTLTALNEKITAYENSIANKDTSYANKSALRRELSALMEEAKDILREELDEFAEIFETTNPAFYNGYKSASVIRDV